MLWFICILFFLQYTHFCCRCDAGTKASVLRTNSVYLTTISRFTGHRWMYSYCRRSMRPLRYPCNVTSRTDADSQSVAFLLYLRLKSVTNYNLQVSVSRKPLITTPQKLTQRPNSAVSLFLKTRAKKPPMTDFISYNCYMIKKTRPI